MLSDHVAGRSEGPRLDSTLSAGYSRGCLPPDPVSIPRLRASAVIPEDGFSRMAFPRSRLEGRLVHRARLFASDAASLGGLGLAVDLALRRFLTVPRRGACGSVPAVPPTSSPSARPLIQTDTSLRCTKSPTSTRSFNREGRSRPTGRSLSPYLSCQAVSARTGTAGATPSCRQCRIAPARPRTRPSRWSVFTGWNIYEHAKFAPYEALDRVLQAVRR